MKVKGIAYFVLCLLIVISGCDDDEKDTNPVNLQLTSVKVGTYALELSATAANDAAPADKPIVASFSAALKEAVVPGAVTLASLTSGAVPLTFSFLDNGKTFSALPNSPLAANEQYTLTITDVLEGVQDEQFQGYSIKFATAPAQLEIVTFTIGTQNALTSGRITDVDVAAAQVDILFNAPLDPTTVSNQTLQISTGGIAVAATVNLTDDNKKIVFTPSQKLKDLTRYQILITDKVKGSGKETMQQNATLFYTAADPVPDFPVISDELLLTLVQEKTFEYFWSFAHPVSGLARERNTSGDVVTTGGSGFGIMALIVGIERGFITRPEGIGRLSKIVTFLQSADRFHGAWPHWMHGATGDVIPFSANDNGGDLVETSFLMEGLLTVRQYLQPADTAGNNLINKITTLFNTVEWDWYTKSEQVLYWHWSPDKAWAMNHRISGYNEALITYFLAAASPMHSIAKTAYDQGWARNGGMVNGKSFYSTTLPLGFDYGGPLFFTHYSFLGLDPRTLEDSYADYWTQNVNHTMINQAYCIDNPKNFVGYSDNCWGLTASDNSNGYNAHSPTNDLGVITPTAALSSFPYAPTESMTALKFFYYTVGDRLWGQYGFYDAMDMTEGWTADSYLAIDQGPIVIMIENYRTGLLWELFMSAPEVQTAKTTLGFN